MENNGRYTNPYPPHPDNPTAWSAQRVMVVNGIVGRTICWYNSY